MNYHLKYLFCITLIVAFGAAARAGAQGNTQQTPASTGPGDVRLSSPATPNAQGVISAQANGSLAPLPALAASARGAAMIELAARFEALRPDQITTQAQALDDAKARVKRGDAAGAAAKLAAFNFAKPNTAEWHMETHGRLMQLAEQFSRAGNTRDSKGVVIESLKQLGEAERVAKTAGDSVGQARAKSAAGVIHERYSGDPVSALVSYRVALQLDPLDQGTKEAYERLQRSYQSVLARTKPATPPKK